MKCNKCNMCARYIKINDSFGRCSFVKLRLVSILSYEIRQKLILNYNRNFIKYIILGEEPQCVYFLDKVTAKNLVT